VVRAVTGIFAAPHRRPLKSQIPTSVFARPKFDGLKAAGRTILAANMSSTRSRDADPWNQDTKHKFEGCVAFSSYRFVRITY